MARPPLGIRKSPQQNSRDCVLVRWVQKQTYNIIVATHELAFQLERLRPRAYRSECRSCKFKVTLTLVDNIFVPKFLDASKFVL